MTTPCPVCRKKLGKKTLGWLMFAICRAVESEQDMIQACCVGWDENDQECTPRRLRPLVRACERRIEAMEKAKSKIKAMV